MSARAFVVVLDACGVGALPDAADYGDAGADTLGHLAAALGGLELPTLGGLGLGNVVQLSGVPPVAEPALHGRLHPLGPGKDSATGHWELMGVVPPHRLPTFPQGFPRAVVDALSRATGRGILCNASANGIEAIECFGAAHVQSGDLIVYTSVDSVLQIAAHEDVVAVEELYAACATARELMTGEHAVGRVIARPFSGGPAAFRRTDGRRDYALEPPGPSYLEALASRGVPVHGVGKVGELFAGVGVEVDHKAPTNATAITTTERLLGDLDGGLVFTNLVETDQLYGHRRDLEGFHGALREIDAAVARWIELLGPGDLLVLTADHGVDPTTPGSDHTREYAPLLAVGGGAVAGGRHDGPLADVGATVLRWLCDADEPALPGRPFA